MTAPLSWEPSQLESRPWKGRWQTEGLTEWFKAFSSWEGAETQSKRMRGYLRKIQWNCIFPKVLLNFFQKIFRVWGETPRPFSPIKFCICFLYYFDTIFPIWKNHSLLYCDFLFFNIYEYSKKIYILCIRYNTNSGINVYNIRYFDGEISAFV